MLAPQSAPIGGAGQAQKTAAVASDLSEIMARCAAPA
ncbi:hypothetical protein C357_21710 [Citreicella sp. 357]|nr:hypothetical protein C357_21710 [Citreicella sp. 357]